MHVHDIQGLHKTYPGQERPANSGPTLEIHEGEIFGLLGDNGAGKTTLVRQMVNLLRPRLGHLSPATYAASALRQTVVGPLTA